MSNLKFNTMKRSSLFWNFVLLVVDPASQGAREMPTPNATTAELKGAKDLVPAKLKEADLKDFGAGQKSVELFKGTAYIMPGVALN
jgi:hypothetical protein